MVRFGVWIFLSVMFPTIVTLLKPPLMSSNGAIHISEHIEYVKSSVTLKTKRAFFITPLDPTRAI